MVPRMVPQLASCLVRRLHVLRVSVHTVSQIKESRHSPVLFKAFEYSGLCVPAGSVVIRNRNHRFRRIYVSFHHAFPERPFQVGNRYSRLHYAPGLFEHSALIKIKCHAFVCEHIFIEIPFLSCDILLPAFFQFIFSIVAFEIFNEIL